MQEKTDAELVTLARDGNKEAFGRLFERYQAITLRFAMRLVSSEDTARDVVQESMLQAYLSLKHLRDPSRFKSWLYGIVLNICRNYLGNQNITYCSLDDNTGGLAISTLAGSGVVLTPEKITEDRELCQIVLGVINTLPDKEREVITLFYYHQLNIEEIAALQGISSGAVKVRLHRARRRLREMISSQYPEIINYEQRRQLMIKVIIADVVKKEWKDETGYTQTQYVVVLQDEDKQRAMNIWVGSFEGQSIARGISKFSFPRPMTFEFFAGLLQAIDAKIEHIRIETLKDDTFYAIVKIRRGKIIKEIDARPSDAMALALLTGSPMFAAEDVLTKAGHDIPKTAQLSPVTKGIENIRKEFEAMQKEWHRRPLSAETIKKENEDMIAAVFGK